MCFNRVDKRQRTGVNKVNKRLLAALIALSGLSDTEIANQLGMTKTTFYRKFRGESEYTRTEIEAFAAILDSDEVKQLLVDLCGIKSAKDVFFWSERC